MGRSVQRALHDHQILNCISSSIGHLIGVARFHGIWMRVESGAGWVEGETSRRLCEEAGRVTFCLSFGGGNRSSVVIKCAADDRNAGLNRCLGRDA